MKINEKFNPYEMDNATVYRIYSEVVGHPENFIRKYLTNVQKLDGKFPDGRFTRQLSAREQMLIEGFRVQNYGLYLRTLPDAVRERISHYTFDDFHDSKKGRIWKMIPEEGRAELKFCRDNAIIETLGKLIPQFSDLFERKTGSVPTSYNAMGCGKNSKSSRGMRR